MMPAILEQPVSKAAAWSRRLGIFSAMLFLTAAIGHRQGFLETIPFLAVLVVVAVLAVGALLLAAYAFSRLWNHGDIGGWNLSLGALIATIVLAPFLYIGFLGLIDPPLNDISTDLERLPALVAPARTAEMNVIADPTPEQQKLQGQAYPDVTGRRYDLPFDRATEAATTVIARQGWVVTAQTMPNNGELTIEAIGHTFLLGFPFDVAVRLTDEGISTYVDMRSASRYGRYDFGDNASRITAFLAELDREIAAQAGTLPAQ